MTRISTVFEPYTVKRTCSNRWGVWLEGRLLKVFNRRKGATQFIKELVNDNHGC
ncbi:MAG: hypothetical protein WDA42_00860 [Candidatus Bathyarchaeia archaeon]